MGDLMAALGWIVLWLVGYSTSTIWRGFVLTLLWSWFIQPLFPAAPDLTIAFAVGLSLTVGYLTYTYIPTNTDKSPRERMAEAFSAAYATPTIALAIGCIVHLFAGSIA